MENAPYIPAVAIEIAAIHPNNGTTAAEYLARLAYARERIHSPVPIPTWLELGNGARLARRDGVCAILDIVYSAVDDSIHPAELFQRLGREAVSPAGAGVLRRHETLRPDEDIPFGQEEIDLRGCQVHDPGATSSDGTAPPQNKSQLKVAAVVVAARAWAETGRGCDAVALRKAIADHDAVRVERIHGGRRARLLAATASRQQADEDVEVALVRQAAAERAEDDAHTLVKRGDPVPTVDGEASS